MFQYFAETRDETMQHDTIPASIIHQYSGSDRWREERHGETKVPGVVKHSACQLYKDLIPRVRYASTTASRCGNCVTLIIRCAVSCCLTSLNCSNSTKCPMEEREN